MRAGVGPQNGVSADVVGVAHSPTDMVGLDQKIVEIVLGVHNRTEVVEKLKILIETGEMSSDDVLDRADWMVSTVVEVTANFRGDGLRHIVLRTVRQQGGTWPKPRQPQVSRLTARTVRLLRCDRAGEISHCSEAKRNGKYTKRQAGCSLHTSKAVAAAKGLEHHW